MKLHISARLLGATVLGTLMLSGCSANPGYSDNKATLWPFDSIWTAGLTHPDYPHIYSDEKEGYWDAVPGYTFVGTTLNVVWTPGATHPDFPHIYADTTENNWHTEAGYGFQDGTLQAIWWPGASHPDNAAVYASFVEGTWLVKPGYLFVANSSQATRSLVSPIQVEWREGLPFAGCPYIVSDSEPGKYRTKYGYSLVNSQDPEDIVLQSTYTDEDRTRDVVMGIIVAVIAHGLSQEQENDGFVQKGGRAVAGVVRDEAIKSTWTSLTSDSTTQYHCNMTWESWARAATT